MYFYLVSKHRRRFVDEASPRYLLLNDAASFFIEGKMEGAMENWNVFEKEVTRRIDLFCETVEQKRRSLTDALERIVSRVRRFAAGLESYCDTEARFGALCRELGFLEEEKRDLDFAFSDFLQIGVAVADLKMELTKSEGDCGFRTKANSDAAELVGFLQKQMRRVEEAEQRYLKDCATFGGVLREMLPLFWEDLYHLSDGEHDGRGFRTQSVLARCGMFCNDIENNAQI